MSRSGFESFSSYDTVTSYLPLRATSISWLGEYTAPSFAFDLIFASNTVSLIASLENFSVLIG